MSADRCPTCAAPFAGPVRSDNCPVPEQHAQVLATLPAWVLIGYEGTFRLPGGRTSYEAVMPPLRSDRPRLARLEAATAPLRQVNRYVAWDQPVEVFEVFSVDLADLIEAVFRAEEEIAP